MFCPSCLAKGPQGPDFANAIAQWMLRFGAEHPAEDDALTKACPYCAWEEVVEGNNGLGNEPALTGVEINWQIASYPLHSIPLKKRGGS